MQKAHNNAGKIIKSDLWKWERWNLSWGAWGAKLHFSRNINHFKSFPLRISYSTSNIAWFASLFAGIKCAWSTQEFSGNPPHSAPEQIWQSRDAALGHKPKSNLRPGPNPSSTLGSDRARSSIWVIFHTHISESRCGEQARRWHG